MPFRVASIAGKSGSCSPRPCSSTIRQSLGAAVGGRRTAGAEAGRTSGTQSPPAAGRPAAHRTRPQARAASSGLRERSVDVGAGRPPDRERMRGPLPRRPCVADSATTGMELPTACRTGTGAGRREDPAMEAEALAGVKKNAKNEGRTIVFIDESGRSQRPHRCRTWAPRGQTPVLQY